MGPDVPVLLAALLAGLVGSTHCAVMCGGIATGFSAMASRQGWREALQLNLGRVGGLLEAKKIAGMAEVRHVQIAPHLYCGPVVGAANVQLATCSPNFLILESIESWGGFHSEILTTPIQFENGHVIPS